jgi:putative transposase
VTLFDKGESAPMSWQKTPIKYQKMKFISEWLDCERSFTDLCERFQISRQCGYDLVNRFKREGEAAFEERSHARHNHPNQTPNQITEIILSTKQKFPDWGPVAIKAWLEAEYADQNWPASSTIGDLFKKNGLVKKRRLRKRAPPFTEPLKHCNASNEVWSADYKGQFKLTNDQYCYPLTITDNFSRYIFCCDAYDKISGIKTMKSFERVFYEYGMPDAIRTDNGYPFAGNGIGGLSRLSIWLVKLNILPERIEPGCPQQNPRHERMHKTLKIGLESNTQSSISAQQKWFNKFRREFNEQRPHQALSLKRPMEIHSISRREYPDRLNEIVYPDHFLIRKVRTSGEIKYCGKRYYLTELLHGEPIGLEMIDEEKAVVYFGMLKLGIIDSKLDKIRRP